MTTQTVTYLLPCAAMPRGCASALAIDGPPGIDMLELDPQAPEDKRVHGLITAAGWRLDHGKWVCANHPFTTPAGPVTVTYWPAAPTTQEAEAAKRAVLETVHELLAEQQGAGLPGVVVDERVPPGVIALASDSHVIAYREDTGRAAEMRRDEHGQWSQPQPVDEQAH